MKVEVYGSYIKMISNTGGYFFMVKSTFRIYLIELDLIKNKKIKRMIIVPFLTVIFSVFYLFLSKISDYNVTIFCNFFNILYYL